MRRQLLYSFEPRPSFDFEQVNCRRNSIEALHNTPTWTNEAPSRFEFYVDGSFHHDCPRATTGVVLIVVTDNGPCFGGYQSSFSWYTPSAPRAESSASVLALHWALHLVQRYGYNVPCAFLFDCVYAGRIAQGLSSPACNHDIAIVERSLNLWLETFLHVKTEWTHIKGHSGHPWNDLADSIAFAARKSQQVTTDLDAILECCSFRASDFAPLQWLWLYEMSLQGHSDAPLLKDRCWKFNCAAPMSSVPKACLHPFVARLQQASVSMTQSKHLRLRVATANVLTLYPMRDFSSSVFGARAEHLAKQFHSAGLQCIGLQETRCRRQGHDQFERFHVLSGCANDRGQGCVQLWLRSTIVIGTDKIQLSTDHLRLIHGDDRRLIVKIAHPQLHIVVLVLHAPCVDEADFVRNWWLQTSQILPNGLSSWDCVLLCDANSRIGSVTSSLVGSFGAEPESMRGALFHEWLLRHNIFLPQTFAEAHHGSHHTWQHAVHGSGRIDFIGVSNNIPVCHTSTWIDDRIDLSIARPDHECVCADIWITLRHNAAKPEFSAGNLDVQNPCWSHDVHTHAALLQHRLLSTMPDKMSTLRKKHLTAETVELIRRKKLAFRRLRDHRRTHRQTWLRIVFQQWRSAYDPCVMPCHELKDINFKVAFAEMKYHSLSLQVGVAVRRDDTTFYTDLAEETGRVARTGFCRIWDAIRPVLPKWRNRRRNNLRCQGPTPEQQIAHYCTLEGGSELSYEDLLKKCHAHQQAQAHDQPLQLSLESGSELSYEDLLKKCHAHQQAQAHDQPLQLSLEQLPSRIDVENRLQRLTPYRAPGIDGLSPQFLKQQGADAAEPIFQLALKMWLTGHEPVQFKGRRLFSISKKAFSRDVSHMRGIMLIDVIGKVMHAIMRQRFLPYVLRWRHPLQLGGFPKCTTLFATHYLKEVYIRAQILQLSFGVLFLDVKSAFHSMIRQLLFGDDVDLPAHLLRLLEDAGCDPSQLQQEISKASQAFLQQVPVHEQRLIKDAHHSTWFCIPGTTSSFETSRGSRPGSPLADIAFNAMMVKVLTKFQELLQNIPALQNGLCHLGLPAPPVTWVDDVAVPIVVTEGRFLEPTIQQVTLAAVDAFLAAGMTLNFKRQKTEVVVDFRGEGASALRHALFVERLGHITLPSRDAPLKCVAIYEHLGTQFSADGSLKHGITHRRSRAIQAHRQVAKSILKGVGCS